MKLTAEGKLSSCPDSPNCVCSDAEQADSHYIPSLTLSGDAGRSWHALIDYLEGAKEYTIVEKTDDYIHAEARTRLLRFVDDVEFHLRPDANEIAVRSASRLGYSDLGANRRRIEALRSTLAGSSQ